MHHSLNWGMHWNDFLLIVVPGSALYLLFKQLHLSFHAVQRQMMWDVLRRWDRGSPMINDERAKEGIGAPPSPSRALTGRGTRGPSAIWEPHSEPHQSVRAARSFSGPFLPLCLALRSAFSGPFRPALLLSSPRLASVCQEASVHLPTLGEKRVGIFMVLVWLILRGH